MNGSLLIFLMMENRKISYIPQKSLYFLKKSEFSEKFDSIVIKPKLESFLGFLGFRDQYIPVFVIETLN